MRSPTCRALLALSIASLSATACVDADGSDLGTVSLNLVGQAPSGTVYRLRDAVIDVTGPSYSQTWNTEDDPDRTSLSADVAVGDYQAELAAGWRLERLAPPDPPVTVDATLLSDNPLPFTVSAGARTRVPLRFRVEDGVVALDQGYDIEIDVEEPAPPVVTLDTVMSPTGNPRPSFTFTVVASGPVSTQCQLDSSPLASCSSPYTAPAALADGPHTFQVIATDGMGRTGMATTQVVVDTTPPAVTITSTTTVTSDSTPSFTFVTSGGAVATTCRVDGGGASACTSPVTLGPLADGSHLLTVTAVDAAGNTGTASHGFTIDTVAPNVTITSYPTQTVYTSTASFAWATSGSPTATLCSVYPVSASPGPFVACASPYAATIPPFSGPLASFRFQVTAVDAAGNASNATVDFTAGVIF